ncbi:hypothetical protein K505DRAFT_372989 [Melanomma pulvis-pyrius CBS 109.77]|uniref:Uncharacterized protein n=1 Tax=Melanomma pulvis-pyrius CBS 109.77 TaxID=1314802 RepID=A0A6A6XJJ8_9PLEO|nr:hypothetical protein K505DRAFT_372989 [Melanomma pulvis-pyrius CBS 109.77]
MCQILLQVYGCGHTKPICTTPCPHALATTYRNPFLDTNTNSNTPSTPATPITPVSPIYMAPDTPARPQHEYAGPALRPMSPEDVHSAALSPAGPMTMSTPHSPTASTYDSDPTPNFCGPPHQHAKYLRPSKYPCLTCYMQPQWAGYRQRWVGEYRAMHPGTRAGDLERMAGVEQIPGRVGLLNVVREVDRLASAREREAMGEGETRR